MAQQALTTQAISGGRFTLGIGLSHQPIIESSYGYSFDKPSGTCASTSTRWCRWCREGNVAFRGETVTARIGLDVRGASPVRVCSPRSARRCSSSPAAGPTAPSPG